MMMNAPFAYLEVKDYFNKKSSAAISAQTVKKQKSKAAKSRSIPARPAVR